MADVIHATLQQVQNLSTGIGRVLRDHQRRLKLLEERGGQTNVLEAVLVNGTQLIPNAAKAVNIRVPAKVSDLTNDKKFQENVIEQVLVNGVKMPVDDKKRVTVTLPTQTSNLQNDAGYQTNTEVLAAIKANAYVHPNHTAYGSGLYKIVVDNLGHVTSAAKAVKSDITALGIPGQDTVYTHPRYTARGTGLYKIAVDALGHVSSVVGVSKGDITALGIPGQDTVYTHPGYTGHGLGLYKLAVDGQGHVSSVAGVTKGDITALGIPGQDTNSWRGIQNNLSSDSTSDSLSAAMGKALNTSLNDAIGRIANCEQKIKAIGGVTKVLIRTAVSSTVSYDAMYRGTVTIATCESEVALVEIAGSTVLRGSNRSIYHGSYEDTPAGVTKALYCIFTFQADGAITVTVDRASTSIQYDGGGNYSWNISYYKYAA